MRLMIENFAKIRKADLQFDGITVIAGNNNTGKSTIGKILFSLFHTLKGIDSTVSDQRKFILSLNLNNLFTEEDNTNAMSMDLKYNFDEESVNFILEKIKDSPDDWHSVVYDYLKSKYPDDKKVTKLIDTGKILDTINNIVNISDKRIETAILEMFFNKAFNNQINSLIESDLFADINLNLKNDNIFVRFDDDRIIKYEKNIKILSDAFYIDNPFVIDDLASKNDENIKRILLDSDKTNQPNVIGSIIAEQKLSAIYDKLQSVLEGKFISRNHELFLKNKKFKKEINVKNLSAGLKSFAILRKLLENGSLRDRDILILDEPEIHLHPQWQLIYAEVIVLLQKTFNLTILLTTHSPFFLDAIEVFSAKHEISARLHYYLSVKKEQSVTFEDVTNNIEAIYSKMAEPMQFLENLRNQIRMEG